MMTNANSSSSKNLNQCTRFSLTQTTKTPSMMTVVVVVKMGHNTLGSEFNWWGEVGWDTTESG